MNLDLIHRQNALLIGTQIVVSARRVLAAHPPHHLVRHGQASRGVNDPTGQARGHPARAATGSFTPRLAYQPRRRGSDTGGIERRPIATMP